MGFSETAARKRIFRDMSEGVLVIGLNGRIEQANPKACELLAISEQDALEQPFASFFFERPENDLFAQTVLEAIYDADALHKVVTPYFDGVTTKYFHVTTSFLMEDGQRMGVIAVFADISELVRLRLEVEEKNRRILSLLESIVQAFSTAVDERSHYTANHTKNMVRFAEAFLDWLEKTNHPNRFDEERRRAFLMSVWLHDIGKMAVPLGVMDKADRLGRRMERISARFRAIGLLNRLEESEGKIGAEEAARRRAELEEARRLIERVNQAGLLPDEDIVRVEELAKRTFTDENGDLRPWITEDERLCLSIRKGTLTSQEREIMQSHVSVTERILNRISFPAAYAKVPEWASAHHEQLNGRGYPRHLKADSIPAEVRLLTILDIFEALTAKDRPYKKAIPYDESFAILRNMAQEGAVDGDLLALFEESGAWKETAVI